MHHQVWPQVKEETHQQLALENVCASQHQHLLQRGQTYRSSHFLTNGLGDTLEKDHAVSTSSVDVAAGFRLTEFELVRGSGGQMEAPHGSHAFKKSRGWRGNQQPTDGKVRDMYEEDGGGRGSGYNVLKSCTVLPNTKQLITAQKKLANWAERSTRKKTSMVKTADRSARCIMDHR